METAQACEGQDGTAQDCGCRHIADTSNLTDFCDFGKLSGSAKNCQCDLVQTW